MRVKRLAQGNYGDCKLIGEGLSELRMIFDPGYQMYFGETADHLMILLCGGDIIEAKAYCKEYQRYATLPHTE